jgi:predicted membrane protein
LRNGKTETEAKMEIKKRRTKTVYRIFWGVVFLLAGAAIILNLAGVLVVPNGINTGDAIWTVVLALVVLWSAIHRFWFFTFLALVGLGYVWRVQIGVGDVSFWPVIGAALLLSIGFSILFKGRSKRWWGANNEEWSVYHRAKMAKKVSAEREYNGADYEAKPSVGLHSASTEDGSDVYIKASFGTTVKYVDAQALKHAVIDCSFGSVKAFFDNAVVDKDGAIIEIFNSFGGVEIYLPRNWRLIDDVNCVFAGIDVKNPGFEQAAGSTVTLKGEISFGGVEIIYV